jgi:excisionase family DNA binding protein
MNKNSTGEPLLNAAEVAEILHISKASAYSLMKTKEIPTVRIKSMVRVRRGDLERYIREKTALGTLNPSA